MKYLFIKLKEQRGEDEWTHLSVHVIPENIREVEKFADAVAIDCYENDFDGENDGIYSFREGEIWITIEEIKEISKEESDILKRFI